MRWILRPTGDKPRFPRLILVLVLVVALAIIAGGVWFIVEERRSAFAEIEDDLRQVSELKVDQIVSWRRERLADAAELGASPTFATAVAKWLSSGRQDGTEDLLETLRNQTTFYGYVDARLVDPAGEVLLSTSETHGPLSDEALRGIEAALKEGAVLTDLHRDAGDDRIHLSAIARVSADGAETGGSQVCVVLVAHADEFLFPRITSWPVPSDTAETLLVRRDGDEVLFLNELRHRSGTALSLREPLSNTSLPAVLAVLGHEGIVEGTDYRGRDVVAAVRSIPDSPWFVVAKMDRSEAIGGATTPTALIGAVMAVLLAGLLGGAGLIWQRGLKQQYVAAFEAERARHELAERFENLVKQANDIILLTDTEGRLIEANDRAVESYGYPRDELLGMRAEQLVSTEEAGRVKDFVREAAEGGSGVHETIARRKDGSLFPAEVSDRLFTIGGRPHIQAIIRDNTARKQAEAERLKLERQLQHSQRLESLGVLAGGIAHDFNNILTAVLGHADLVLHDLPLSSPGRQGVQEIVVAARRAAELCRQMLAYSGRGQFVIENIDLTLLVEDMLNLVSSAIPKKTLLNLNLAHNLPPIQGDVSQMNQVIMNLVINAAEAIGERSGVITISVGAQECSSDYLEKTYYQEGLTPGLYISLEVSDTGVGMDKETMSRLFEPFFTTKFTGRGLGLSAVLGIVRGHKGALRVYSEPGRGSTFKVLFPAVETDLRPIATADATAKREWTGAGTILLADDEETIRALGKRMLERIGFEVVLAADGLEAVESYVEHENEISLVILDLTMPRMNGEEAFRKIREIDPEVPILISSGYAETEIASRFAGKGTAGFVQKPYTLDVLTERVRAALEKDPTEREDD